MHSLCCFSGSVIMKTSKSYNGVIMVGILLLVRGWKVIQCVWNIICVFFCQLISMSFHHASSNCVFFPKLPGKFNESLLSVFLLYVDRMMGLMLLDL